MLRTSPILLMLLTLPTLGQSIQPSPQEAAQHLVSAAEVALNQVKSVESIRGFRSPEFDQLHLATLENLLHSRLAAAVNDAQRAQAYNLHLAYLDQLAAREAARQIDGLSIAEPMIKFARSKAAYQRMKTLPSTPAAAQTEQNILEQLRASAATTLERVIDLEDIRRRTPELMQLVIDGANNLLYARLAGDPTDEQKNSERKKYEGFLAGLQQEADRISEGRGQWIVDLKNYLRAAQIYDKARETDANNGLRKAADDCATAAKTVVENLANDEQTYGRSPEFLYLELAWAHRLLDAQLAAAQLTTPGRKHDILLAHKNSLTVLRTRILQLELDTPPLTHALLDYALAEIDYLLLTLH